MNAPVTTRPAPARGLLEDAFWSHVQKQQLSLQRCSACHHIWYPPGPVCPSCLSSQWQWQAISGWGRVHAWTVFHRAYFAELATPYTIVSVQVDEGPLLIGGIDSETPLQVGLRVQAFYERTRSKDRDEWLIYQWRAADRG
jgi:uncharacterized OB-fold protein